MNFYALENYLYNKENSLNFPGIIEWFNIRGTVLWICRTWPQHKKFQTVVKEKHKMEQPERYDLVPTLNDLGQLK